MTWGKGRLEMGRVEMVEETGEAAQSRVTDQDTCSDETSKDNYCPGDPCPPCLGLTDVDQPMDGGQLKKLPHKLHVSLDLFNVSFEW